jgi:hypothetical protein
MSGNERAKLRLKAEGLSDTPEQPTRTRHALNCTAEKLSSTPEQLTRTAGEQSCSHAPVGRRRASWGVCIFRVARSGRRTAPWPQRVRIHEAASGLPAEKVSGTLEQLTGTAEEPSCTAEKMTCTTQEQNVDTEELNRTPGKQNFKTEQLNGTKRGTES